MHTHQEIRDHFVHIRDNLKRWDFDASKMADICGVKRQTFYQYGFRPEARGARMIPADALDRLRLEHVRHELRRYILPAFCDKNQHIWIVKDASANTVEEAYFRPYARFTAAIVGGSAVPGPQCIASSADYQQETASCNWLRIYHGGHVTPEDAMQITRLGRYDVGLVGLNWLSYGIAPQPNWIAGLSAITDRRKFLETRNAA